MKNIILSILILATGRLAAQDIVLSLYSLKDKNYQLSEAQQNSLTSKVQSWLTEQNVGSADVEAPMGLVPEVILNEPRTVTAGLRNLTVYDGELILTAQQKDGKQTFGVYRKKISGSGTSNALAMSSMVSNIPSTDAKFADFITSLKPKVIKFYTENCNNLMAEATRQMDAGQMKSAMSTLLNIPAQAPCRADADNKLKANYARYREFVCNQALMAAKASVAAKDYQSAVKALRLIDPEAQCAKEATTFIAEMQKNADSDFKAQLETVKEYFKALANQQNWQIVTLRDYMNSGY